MNNFIEKNRKLNGLKLDPNANNNVVLWEQSKNKNMNCIYKYDEIILDTVFVMRISESISNVMLEDMLEDMKKDADNFVVSSQNSWLLGHVNGYKLKAFNITINTGSETQINPLFVAELGLIKINNTWVLPIEQNIVVVKETYEKGILQKIEINKAHLDKYLKNHNYGMVIALCSEVAADTWMDLGLTSLPAINKESSSTSRGKEQIQHIKDFNTLKYTEWAIRGYNLDNLLI